jgi:glycogen debranching enzyme
MPTPFFKLTAAFFILTVLVGCGSKPSDKPLRLDELSITVSGTSREVAYTNKHAGFFYTETNGPHRSSWQGWNVMAKEILEDYQIIDGEITLRRPGISQATVLPDQLIRTYKTGQQETFTLLDSVDAFVVQAKKLKGTSVRIRPRFRDADRQSDYLVKFRDGVLLVAHQRHLKRTAQENYPVWIGIAFGAGAKESQCDQTSDTTGASFSPAAIASAISAQSVTAVFAAGDTEDETVSLALRVAADFESLIAQRRRRMENVLNRSFVRTDNARFDKAFHWALLSMDALVMNQIKKGIFAGLPWFDNYWGRDSFIALPGAALVTGDFSEAKQILQSFAEWQEKNPGSPNYGRIPNLATTGSVAYNTTDGTPRFVIALMDYFKYSGDTSFVLSTYPVVKRSIEGALTHHLDPHGFLKHGEAETWMDAVGPAGPWSPRGDRANDVQALWHHQLKSGVALAELAGDRKSAVVWDQVATAVRANFNKYFLDSARTMIIDHLNSDGSQDRRVRPNQLYALDLLTDETAKARIFRSITEKLVYTHGVASLSQDDPDFHPFHHYEPNYVQDAAYHNGIVWTWLAGAWIDAATSYRLPNLAFRVTDAMVDQMLNRGAVGTISELLDAAPRRGEKEPRLSGTFSQAWSIAEFLRVFYQDYLGIRVDAPGKKLILSPRLPGSIRESRSVIAVGTAHVSVSYRVSARNIEATLRSSNTYDTIAVTFNALVDSVTREMSASLPPGHVLKMSLARKGAWYALDSVRHEVEAGVQSRTITSRALEGTKLATPIVSPDLKSLKGPSHRLLSNAEITPMNAQAVVLLDATDPEGDDTGTGGYVYPRTPLLKPGSLDITHCLVSADEKNMYFTLQFRDLSNPGWHPEYGFQLTYVAIAIDKDGTPGSGATAIGMNSNYTLDPRFAYESIIYVGGGIRIADSKGTVLAEYIPIPGDEISPLGKTQKKLIEFALPIGILGKPTPSWRYTVLVGCQDDHGGAGIGDFRGVEATAGEWTGGGKKKPGDPNVYDVILPVHRQ